MLPTTASTKMTIQQSFILMVVLAADVLDLMDSTICNIAAPSIVSELGGGEALIKWLGAGYALAMGALLVLGGRLGDLWGQRRMFLWGLGGFTLASAACGLSVGPATIIVSRIVQGAFGALLLPQGLSLLLSNLRRDQLPTAFSAFGPTMGLAAVLGPIVAGFLISADWAGLSWRPVFLINLILGTATFLTALKVLPPDGPRTRQPVDAWGTLLLGLGLLFVFYGLIEGAFQTPIPTLSMGVGVVLMAAFAVRQLYARHPLIQMSLFGNRGFAGGLLIGLGFFSAVNGFSYVTGLFFQLDLHLSPSTASLALAPLLVGIITASVFGRPLISLWGRKLVLAGLLVTLAGAGGLVATVAWGGPVPSPWSFAPSLFVIGLGMGACFGSLFDVALGNVAHEESGSASGSLSAVQQLANAIGAAVVTAVYFGQAISSGGSVAFERTALIMAAVVFVCLALVPLLPKKAQQEAQT